MPTIKAPPQIDDESPESEGRPCLDAFREPYRLGCPAGHTFCRDLPIGRDEYYCGECDETYPASRLVDRKLETHRPAWARRGGA